MAHVRVHQGPELHHPPPHLLIPLPGGGGKGVSWKGSLGVGITGEQGSETPMPAWPGSQCPHFTLGPFATNGNWSSEEGKDLAKVTQQIKW